MAAAITDGERFPGSEPGDASMFHALRLALACAAITSLTSLAWGQKPAANTDRQVSPQHDIPADSMGNVIRITGHCNSKSPDTPNGVFSIRLPKRAARGVQITSGQVAISGATIDREGVQSNRLIKSTVDYVTINAAGNAVEFSTRTQDGVLRLPLQAEKDAQVVVVIYLETAEGAAGFRYFLNPKGLSFEPIEKKSGKKSK